MRRGDLIVPRVRYWEKHAYVWTRIPRGKSHRIPTDAVGIVVRSSGQHPRALFMGRVWTIIEANFAVVETDESG